MRTIVVACIAVVAMVSTGSPAQAIGNITATGIHLQGQGTILSWTPAAGATSYEIYRAVDGGSSQLLTTTSASFLYDANAPDFGQVTYTILPLSMIPGLSYRSGECVYQNGATIAITVSECAGSSGGPRFAPPGS